MTGRAAKPAIIVDNWDDFRAAGPGAVYLVGEPVDYAAIKCPACGVGSAIPLDGSDDSMHPGWVWNGDCARPTLSPSVHHDVLECGYHGFLRAGEWTLQ